MAQMVLRMTVTAPWDGKDFERVNTARHLMASAVVDIKKALGVEVDYEEVLASVRTKVPT